MLVSFTGAQSTGKTTLLNKCKDQYKGTWNFVDEVTRKVLRKGYKINLNGDNITQLFILNEHLHNHTRSDNCILDRCILDGYVYTCCLCRRGLVDDWVCEYACNMLTELVTNLDIIFYTEPGDVKLVDDGTRSVDPNFRQEIVDRYEELFNEKYFWQSRVVRLYGDVEDRMNTINFKINEYSNIRQQQNIETSRANV